MSTRTFRVRSPLMEGRDIEAWQETLNRQMDAWNVEYRLKLDGAYGSVTRDLAASVCHGFGLSAATAMKDGVTPSLRTKIRRLQAGDLTKAERERYRKRGDWRKRFRERHADRDVASPLSVILSSSWGYHPGVHDGVDLICKPNAPLLAMCTAKVIRVSDDWWGLGSPGGALADKGDGIIMLRSLTDAGPFFKGMNIGYGHAERPSVRVGEVVEAGEVIGRAGFANAWHIHLVVNGRSDDRGVGDRDPMPFVNWARRHG